MGVDASTLFGSGMKRFNCKMEREGHGGRGRRGGRLQLREANPLLPPMSFDNSVSAIVNLVEKCSVSVVFSPVATRSNSPTGIDSSKLVAQHCVLRSAIEPPSVAMGHPSVDMLSFSNGCHAFVEHFYITRQQHGRYRREEDDRIIPTSLRQVRPGHVTHQLQLALVFHRTTLEAHQDR
jgi:hypothetical protein